MTMPSEAPTPTPARTGWAEPRLAYLATRSWAHWGVTVVLGLMVVVGGVMDAQVMQPALNSILRGHAGHVAFISYVVSLLTALMMARAGWLLRGATCDPALRRREGGIAGALVAGWALVGVLICVARWHATGGAVSTGYDGAATASSAQDASAHLAAWVFLGIYAATGLLALVDFYCARNDLFDQKVTALKRLEPARAALIEDEALFHRLSINLTNATHAFAAIPAEGELAKQSQQALVERLKQLALIRFGIDTSSQAVMGVASAAHPLNPRSADQGAGRADAR
ncbi:MAG TPA: hypothetical protein VMU34_02760 [Mycobacterium sp.]|nr:hypothetical protein [Mycobacterium sp.]